MPHKPFRAAREQTFEGRWPASCFLEIMNNIGQLPRSDAAARGVRKTPGKRGRPRKVVTEASSERALPAVGTLTRTKSLLLAALRVWELKHGIR